MEFEDLLEQTGGFGKFQKKLTVLFIIPIYIVIPWYWLNKIFMLSVPQHWCNVPNVDFLNLSFEEQRTLISPPSDPSCSMYSINYTDLLHKDIFKAPDNSEIVPCAAGWKFDTRNYEHTAATKWEMVCDFSYYPSLIFTLGNVGSLVATPIFGFLSDKFGRKIVFLSLACVVMVTEIASALVNDLIIFSAIAVVNGSCLPLMYTLPYILTLELVAPNMRASINGIINTCWTLGLCILPLVAYLSRNWTNLCYITAGTAAFILCYFRYIPESPNWLLSKDKFDDAKKIMIKIGKENGKSINQPEMLLQLQALSDRTKKKKDDEKISESKHIIIRYPRLGRNFLIISFCWTTVNVTYGGLMYNMVNLHGNEFVNFFLVCVAEIPGNFVFWYAMDKFGRKWTCTLGLFLVGVTCLLPIIGFENSGIVSSMIGKFLITGCFMVSDTQGSELFPTVARSFLFGTGKTISSALGLLVPFIAYLNIYGKSLPFLVISCTCFITCGLSLFLPETLNENLPQTISDAENFGKDQKLFFWNWRTSDEKTRNRQIKEENAELQERINVLTNE